MKGTEKGLLCQIFTNSVSNMREKLHKFGPAIISHFILVVCVAGGVLEGGTNGRRQRCNCMQMPVFCLTDHKNEAARKSSKKRR